MPLLVLKFILPYLVKWLIIEAERLIDRVGAGHDKKARVINKVKDFAETTGLIEVLDEEKKNNTTAELKVGKTKNA